MNFLNKTTASSLAKLAKLPVHQHPADLLNTPKTPLEMQYQQIQGKLPFGQNQYCSSHHEQLMEKLVKSREDFRLNFDQQRRTILAENQRGFWNQYTAALLAEMPEEHKLTETHKSNMYESFLVTKQRNEERLTLDRLSNFSNEFTKAFKMDFPVHPLVLLRMAHPHFGYFLSYKQKLTIEEVFDLWHEMISVSALRYQGYSLHASELLSFYFWRQYLKTRGHMTFPEFTKFMQHFKFQIKNDEDFKHRFRFTLEKREKEFSSSKDLIRFDLFREIFLDHDL